MYETDRVAMDGGYIQSFWDLPGTSATIYVSPIEGAAHVTPCVRSVSFLDLLWPAPVEGRLRDLGRRNMVDYLQNPRTVTASRFSVLIPLRYGALLAGWVVFFARRALLAYLRRDRTGLGFLLILWTILRKRKGDLWFFRTGVLSSVNGWRNVGFA